MSAPLVAREDSGARALLERGARLLEAEDLSGALEAFEEGARRFPDEWRFPCNAGTVLHRQGQVGAALRCVNHALARWPSVPLLHHKLGAWLLELEQDEAALRLFERAATLPGAGVESLLQLGVAYLETRASERALATAEQALALAPANAEAHALHGLVLAARGERADSDAALHRALALDPACPQAAHHLARRGELLDPEPLRARLEEENLPAATRSKLAFALGCLHDRRGEHAPAFACFARGNELARRPWDPAWNSRTTDALIEHCRGAFFERVDPTRAGHAPIFVVGLPRTGSTLIEQILSAHPRVHAAGEHALGLPRIARELSALRPGVRAFPAGLGDLAAADLDALARRYLASLPPAREPGLRPVDKLLANFQMLGLVALLFPDARVLNCRRDPRDSGLSTYFLEFQRNDLAWSYDLGHIAQYYRDHERLMAHWTEHLPLPVLDVPYEGLVSEPELWTRRLVGFLGLEWDERCLHHEGAERPVFTASALQVRESVHARSVGRWVPYAAYLGPLAELATDSGVASLP